MTICVIFQSTQGAIIPGTQPVASIEKLEEKASLAVDGVLEGLAYITHKVSCEVTIKINFSRRLCIIKILNLIPYMYVCAILIAVDMQVLRRR